MTDQNVVQTEEQENARLLLERKILVKQCLLLMIFPAFSFLLVFLSADFAIYQDEIESVQETINEYTYAGWPTQNLKTDFEQQYALPEVETYFLEPLVSKDLTYYEARAEELVENARSEIRAELETYRESEKDLQIPGLEQDTSLLDSYIQDVEENLTAGNFYEIQFLLEKIPEEIENLQAQLQADVQGRLDAMVHTIDSMAFMGGYYWADLSSYQQQARDIAATSADPFTKFEQLNTVKSEAAQILDNRILAHGGTPTSGKRILIVIGQQRLYMIEDYNIIYEMGAATGIQGHETAVGEFAVIDKCEMVWGYYEIWMPYWITIYYSGSLKNGIHGIPLSPDGTRWWFWDDDVGVIPVTYGCVMPHDEDAKIVFDWADIGIPVSIVY